MATRRKSVKGTTKRGKVTRVPSRAKAKSAVKTFLNHNTEPYREAILELEGRINEAGVEIEKYQKEIGAIEVSIYSCKRNLEKSIRIRNNCDDYCGNEYKNELSKEIAEYKKRIKKYEKQIEDIRNKIKDKRSIINASKTMQDSLKPILRYHTYHARRDFDRISKASYIRGSRWNEHYDGKPMRRM